MARLCKYVSRFLLTQLTIRSLICKFYRLRCLNNIRQRTLGPAIISFVFSIFLFSRAQAVITVCFGSIKLAIHQQQGKLNTNLGPPTLSEMAARKSLKLPFLSLNRKNHNDRLYICIFKRSGEAKELYEHPVDYAQSCQSWTNIRNKHALVRFKIASRSSMSNEPPCPHVARTERHV